MYRIFIVCGGEYDGDGCRGVFQSLETQAVGKADIRKDKVCRLARLEKLDRLFMLASGPSIVNVVSMPFSSLMRRMALRCSSSRTNIFMCHDVFNDGQTHRIEVFGILYLNLFITEQGIPLHDIFMSQTR